MDCVDFLPKRLRVQRRRRRRLQHQASAVAALLAVLTGLGYAHHVRLAGAEALLAERQARQQDLAAQLAVVPVLTVQLAEGGIKQRISRELGSRLVLNAVMAELGRLLPEQAALTGLQYSTVDVRAAVPAPDDQGEAHRTRSAAAAAAATEKRVRVVITGITPDDVEVADFIGRLSTSSLFTDVQMGFSKTVTLDAGRREGRGFEMSCLLAR